MDIINQLKNQIPEYNKFNFIGFKHNLTLIKQIGPTCGLACIAMMNQNTTIKSLLDLAISLGYTRQGELFSSLNLSNLASKTGINSSCIEFPHPKELVQLLKTGCIAIPYDRDKNNQPILLNGNSCHWSLCIGVILKRLDGGGNVIYTESFKFPELECDATNTYLILAHGLSNYLMIVSYKNMYESCLGLNQASIRVKTGNYVYNGMDQIRGLVVLLETL